MILSIVVASSIFAAADAAAERLTDHFRAPNTEELAAVVDAVDRVVADGPSTRYKLLEIGVGKNSSGISIFCAYANTKNRVGAYVGWDLISGILVPGEDKRLNGDVTVTGEAASVFCTSQGYVLEADRQ